LVQDTQFDPPESIDWKLLDGAAVVHLPPVTNVTTFDEYGDQIFVPHIIKQLENCKRIVFETNIFPTAIKNQLEKNVKRYSEKGNW